MRNKKTTQIKDLLFQNGNKISNKLLSQFMKLLTSSREIYIADWLNEIKIVINVNFI